MQRFFFSKKKMKKKIKMKFGERETITVNPMFGIFSQWIITLA